MDSKVNPNRSTPVSVLSLVAVAFLIAMGAVSTANAQPYLGSETCAECHLGKFMDFRVSGHPYKLSEASKAMERPIPLPEGYNWRDISYVIGGYKWKSRYMDLDGFIITSIKDGTPGMNQYNMMTGRWVDYHPGEEKPYDCGRCHTTGFSPDGSQGGLPGIQGTWEFGGVQCEACHGPSAGGAPFTDDHGFIDDSAQLCGQCHIRGGVDTIPASGGFIRHHEQYNEMLASPHADLACVACHDPHKKAKFSIRETCEDCHYNVAEKYAGSVMDLRGVTCVACHMPFASKSAEALGPHQGDIRTHLFRINTERGAEMFTEDGGFVLLDDSGQGAVTLDFACQVCHTDKGFNWIEGKAKKFHQRG